MQLLWEPPRAKRPRPLGHPSLQLIRIARPSGEAWVWSSRDSLASVLLPLELCEPEAELQQADLREGSFSTCPTVCLSVSSIFVLYQSAKPRGHSAKRGQTAAALGVT